ncbi:MAG: hypothetical protein KC505_11525 [Myxococcales bacterium]|nr:hypothetical protein [Myxococcales bacterium]USN50784.1 MAG: hypothetical protein H6731_11100 [Myxococcales bacterium]
MSKANKQKIDTIEVDMLIDHYVSVIDNRPKALFSRFLVKGYTYTTLDTVNESYFKSALKAKILLGMLITLLDDMADNPHYFNPSLLKILYKVGGPCQCGYQEVQSEKEKQIIELTQLLIKNIQNILHGLPNWQACQEIFLFDVWQIYLANRYSELMTAFPSIRNMTEAKIYGPFNMGMVAAGMIDLMALNKFNEKELGVCREIFLIGQRLGRIGNLIATFEREKKECDGTNEMALYLEKFPHTQHKYLSTLKKEHHKGIKKIKKKKALLRSFNTKRYSRGLEKLFKLHLSMMGTI